MKTYKQCFDKYGHTYGEYHASKYYNKPFEKLKKAGIPEQYDTYITNLPMIPSREFFFNHANFAAEVLIELNKNSLLIGHPKGLDYFHYICQQYSASTINDYFTEDLSAAVKLLADLIKKGLFVDNFDGLRTIMKGMLQYNNHHQKAELLVAFHEKKLSDYYVTSERFHGSTNTIPALLLLQECDLLAAFGKPILETKEIFEAAQKMQQNASLVKNMQNFSLSPQKIITILLTYDNSELRILENNLDILRYPEFLIQFKLVSQAIDVFEMLKPHIKDIIQCPYPFDMAMVLLSFKKNPFKAISLTEEEIVSLILKSLYPEYLLQLLPILDYLKPYFHPQKLGEMDEIIEGCSRYQYKYETLAALINVIHKVGLFNIDTFKSLVLYYQLEEKKLVTMIEVLHNIGVPQAEILGKIDILMSTSDNVRKLLFPDTGEAHINACNYVEIIEAIENRYCILNKISEILSKDRQTIAEKESDSSLNHEKSVINRSPSRVGASTFGTYQNKPQSVPPSNLVQNDDSDADYAADQKPLMCIIS